MLLLLLNYVVLRALWKIGVHLISNLVNKSLYYLFFCGSLSVVLLAVLIYTCICLFVCSVGKAMFTHDVPTCLHHLSDLCTTGSQGK